MVYEYLFIHVGMENEFLQTGLIPIASDVWKLD
jgi:hypothetical protein